MHQELEQDRKPDVPPIPEDKEDKGTTEKSHNLQELIKNLKESRDFLLGYKPSASAGSLHQCILKAEKEIKDNPEDVKEDCDPNGVFGGFELVAKKKKRIELRDFIWEIELILSYIIENQAEIEKAFQGSENTIRFDKRKKTQGKFSFYITRTKDHQFKLVINEKSRVIGNKKEGSSRKFSRTLVCDKNGLWSWRAGLTAQATFEYSIVVTKKKSKIPQNQSESSKRIFLIENQRDLNLGFYDQNNQYKEIKLSEFLKRKIVAFTKHVPPNDHVKVREEIFNEIALNGGSSRYTGNCLAVAKDDGIYKEKAILDTIHSPYVSKFDIIHTFEDKHGKYKHVLDAPLADYDLDTLTKKHIHKKELEDIFLTVYTAFSALQAVHGSLDDGYIHRDIKPENILSKNSRSSIIDFGLAISEKQKTRHLAMATAGYLAPEAFKAYLNKNNSQFKKFNHYYNYFIEKFRASANVAEGVLWKNPEIKADITPQKNQDDWAMALTLHKLLLGFQAKRAEYYNNKMINALIQYFGKIIDSGGERQNTTLQVLDEILDDTCSKEFAKRIREKLAQDKRAYELAISGGDELKMEPPPNGLKSPLNLEPSSRKKIMVIVDHYEKYQNLLSQQAGVLQWIYRCYTGNQFNKLKKNEKARLFQFHLKRLQELGGRGELSLEIINDFIERVYPFLSELDKQAFIKDIINNLSSSLKNYIKEELLDLSIDEEKGTMAIRSSSIEIPIKLEEKECKEVIKKLEEYKIALKPTLKISDPKLTKDILSVLVDKPDVVRKIFCQRHMRLVETREQLLESMKTGMINKLSDQKAKNSGMFTNLKNKFSSLNILRKILIIFPGFGIPFFFMTPNYANNLPYPRLTSGMGRIKQKPQISLDPVAPKQPKPPASQKVRKVNRQNSRRTGAQSIIDSNKSIDENYQEHLKRRQLNNAKPKPSDADIVKVRKKIDKDYPRLPESSRIRLFKHFVAKQAIEPPKSAPAPG